MKKKSMKFLNNKLKNNSMRKNHEFFFLILFNKHLVKNDDVLTSKGVIGLVVVQLGLVREVKNIFELAHPLYR